MVINSSSIRFLHEPGWSIYARKNFQWSQLPQKEGKVVCVLGNFNKGKSWLLSKLSKKNI